MFISKFKITNYPPFSSGTTRLSEPPTANIHDLKKGNKFNKNIYLKKQNFDANIYLRRIDYSGEMFNSKHS